MLNKDDNIHKSEARKERENESLKKIWEKRNYEFDYELFNQQKSKFYPYLEKTFIIEI